MALEPLTCRLSAGLGVAVMESTQPPTISPAPPGESSTTYSVQGPLGAVPLKVESCGVKVCVTTRFVGSDGQTRLVLIVLGRYVPEVTAVSPRIDCDALSCSVTLMLVTKFGPPTSPQSTTFCPCGPTSSMSMSFGKSWVTSSRRTVTLFTVPTRFDTVIVEGYGVARVGGLSLSLMMIVAGEFVKRAAVVTVKLQPPAMLPVSPV